MEKEDRGKGIRSNLGLWLLVVAVFTVIVIGLVMIFAHVGQGAAIEISSQTNTTPAVEVYLSGAVTTEGIYTLEGSSSLQDLLRQAGLLNAEDPIQVKVHVLDEDEDPLADDDPVTGPARINVNTASLELLDTLPGIGPVRAQAIIDHRTEHGPFRSVDELLNVPGIGPVTLENLRPLVTVV